MAQPARTGGGAPATLALEGARPVPFGGGLPAFALADGAAGAEPLMAVQAERHAPPRPHPLKVLTGAPSPGLLAPLAHGPGRGPRGSAYFVVCRLPAGAALGTATTVARRWSEAELLSCVLRPAAAALASLQARHVTHRAIRPDNVFQSAPGAPVVLGSAWAAPPASLQPAVFEPPYSAMCLPAGRGDGSIADDVYALGVLLIALAAGAVPLAGQADAEVIRLKLERGSAAALAAGLGLPVAIAELAAGMLAEDPHHRPSPMQLADPDMARARRVAARPLRRASRVLDVGARAAWDARSLAAAMAAEPQHAARLLRGGAVDRWLRRTLLDPAVAGHLEEAARPLAAAADRHADALLVARAVAVLDPLAPLCWEGLALWPDGLGPALAAAAPDQLETLQHAIEAEAFAAWGAVIPDRQDPVLLRAEARAHRATLQAKGWSGGMAVLRYALNPLAACASAVLGERTVTRVADLLAALEDAAGHESRPALPVDAEAAAFLAAREPLRMGRDLIAMASAVPGAAALAQLRVLARLQQRLRLPPMPRLALWLMAGLRPVTAAWNSRTRRAALDQAMQQRAAEGRLGALLDLVDDAASRTQDERETAAARAALAAIDATLADLAARRTEQNDRLVHLGHEVATALGVIAVSAVAAALALG